MPVSGGTAPVGCPALGSAPGGDVAGVAEASVAGGCVMDAGTSCAIAMPVTPVVKASMAAPAIMIGFIGIVLSLFFTPFCRLG